MFDEISHYSTASTIASLREADEVKTFPLLEMPAPMQAGIKRTKSPPRGIKEIMLQKQKQTLLSQSSNGFLGGNAGNGNYQAMLGGNGNNKDNPVLPGILKTMRPPVGTTRPDDAASKRMSASMWQTVPNYAGLKLDGGPTPIIPVAVQTFLASLEKPKVSVVNLGEIVSKKKDKNFDPGMEELRNYTILMDKFGLNQFMIYRGTTLTSTPEFEGFRSKYNHDWGAITGVIRELEDFLRAREVKLAIINGPRLHEIASLNLPTVHKDDLLSCISNIEEIKSSTIAGKKVSIEKERGAAVTIQARVRAFLGRKRYLVNKRKKNNATVIQSYVRRMIAKRVVKEKLRLSKTHYEDQWDLNVDRLRSIWSQFSVSDQYDNQEINNSTGGGLFAGQTAPSSSTSKRQQQRLLIMVPSIAAAEYVRLSIDRIHTLQNMHIACLYQLVDPNVHVVYISPVQLTTDETTYHERFLAALGVHMPASEAKRLHFIVPELINRLPSHMPMSQVLWCSTSALRKVKAFIRRFPNAYIVPTAMTWVERRLSNLFNVPMLSPDPITADTIRSRSFMKKVFADAYVNVPIGAHDITSSSDFYLALPRLIASNIEVRRWIFRLNVDNSNEGYAYLDVDKLSCMAGLRKEMLALLQQHNNNAAQNEKGTGKDHDGIGGVGAWYNKQVQLDVRKRVMLCIRAEIATKAVICRRDLHGGWEQFERFVRQYGMVIEAEPLNMIGQVQGLCFIDPCDGRVQMSHGVDVLVDDKYQPQAYIGPQSRVPKAALKGATTAIAEFLYDTWGVSGYLTVDYQAYWDTLEEAPKICALGVHFGLTPVFGGLGGAAVASGAMCAPGPATGGESPLSPSLLPRDDSQSLGGKSFVYVPFAYHRPLTTSRDDAFLKFCRMKGITFDPEARIGTLFFHLDSVVSGALSLLSLASTRKRAVETAVQALSFVMDQYGRDREVKEGVDGPTWDSLASILHNLKSLHRRDYKPIVTNPNHQNHATTGGMISNNENTPFGKVGGSNTGGGGFGTLIPNASNRFIGGDVPGGAFPMNAGQGMSNQQATLDNLGRRMSTKNAP